MHKHHIVFRSQRGMDTPLNMIDLSFSQHEGNEGPHQSRESDLKLKLELQSDYYKLFKDPEYSLPDIAYMLGKTEKYTWKFFRTVPNKAGIYQREDIIRKLMGGKTY